MQEINFAPLQIGTVQFGSLLGERAFRNYRGTISFDKFQGELFAVLKELPVYANFCPREGVYVRFRQTEAGKVGKGRISDG